MTDAPAMIPRRPVRAADLAWLAAASACIASVARVIAVFVRGTLLHQFTWTPDDLPWMTLVGNTIIFAGIAIVLAAIGRFVPRLRSPEAAIGVFAVLVTLSVMLLITEIWQYASLAFALGVAVQAMRRVRRDPEAALRRVRGTAVLTGVLACAAAARSVVAHREEPPVASGLPSGTPNVLLIILDTVRASSMSLFGYALPTTPQLERVAADGVLFERAVATAPWTLPSHCSLFTGRDAQRTTCRWMSPLDEAPATLAEVLRARGFRTGGFVANPFYTTRETGLARGFDRWADFKRSWKEVFCSTVLVQTGIVRNALWGESVRQRVSGLWRLRLRGDPKPEHDRKDAATVNREFLAWLDDAPSRPFFAFLNYFDAHDPYRAPQGFAHVFPPAEHKRDQYDGGIAYIDQQIGRLVDELRRRGQLDNTVLVVASDHGELFGEHDLFGHGNSLYWPLLHVPLIVRYPGHVPSGARVRTTVSLRDVAATILDLLGSADLRIGGASLAGTWGDSSHDGISPALAFVEKGTNFWAKEPARFDSLTSITVADWQFVRTAAGREELFNLTKDPLGREDLSAADGDGARRTALRDALRRATALPAIATPTNPD